MKEASENDMELSHSAHGYGIIIITTTTTKIISQECVYIMYTTRLHRWSHYTALIPFRFHDMGQQFSRPILNSLKMVPLMR
jgi:hypothetical protein